MDGTIRIYKKNGLTYFPRSFRRSGYTGPVDVREGRRSLILVRPGTKLPVLKRELEKAINDIEFEMETENLLGQQEEQLTS